MSGIMCDMVWSDPKDVYSLRESPRGAGHLFGKDTIDRFFTENNLEFMVRSHQLVMEGFM